MIICDLRHVPRVSDRVFVCSIVKAPFSKGWRYSSWCIIQLQAFLSGCGTHITYLCNVALCKMITDVVWLYSNIGPFTWKFTEECNLRDTCTVLLNVTLNYGHRLNVHQNSFCCHSEPGNGRHYGNVCRLLVFGTAEAVCLFQNNLVTLISTVFTATEVFWSLDSPYFFLVWYLYIFVIFLL